MAQNNAPASSPSLERRKPFTLFTKVVMATDVQPHSAKRQSTLPMPPSPKKRTFFKRPFSVRRKSQHGSPAPADPPKSPLPQAENHAQAAKPVLSAVHMNSSSASLANGTHSMNGIESVERQSDSSSAIDCDEDLEHVDSTGSRNIRFASHEDVRQDLRNARPSSHSRRTSIYYRDQDGAHVSGVETGVGSKARRLSTAVTRGEFSIKDMCPLKEHFDYVARKRPKQIGEGGAAVVQLMKSKTASTTDEKDKVFAVKKFRQFSEGDETVMDYARKIQSEFCIAKSLSEHPHIVKTHRLCFEDDKTCKLEGRTWYHVMEYCEYGDLTDLIKEGYFSLRDKNCLFKQVVRGVDYMHQHGIAHRDLKSENMLVTKDGCLKIADFGTSEVFSGIHPGFRDCRRPSLVEEPCEANLCGPGIIGSGPYMAPEIVDRKVYDPRCVDVWACAIVYISLLVCGTPWERPDTTVNSYARFCASWDDWFGKYGEDAELDPEKLPLPEYARTTAFRMMESQPMKALVLRMLHPVPKRRISVHEVLESKEMDEIECCQQPMMTEEQLAAMNGADSLEYIRNRRKKVDHKCHRPPAGYLKKPKGLPKNSG
jgi:protein-serine/threonine kinase